jgi:hypothetical protein
MSSATKWGFIPTRFSNFAAWVDSKGRLIRFYLHAAGAAKADPSAERDDQAITPV